MYGIPERDFLSWKAQRDAALGHGIAFRFGLLSWSMWWRHQLALLGPDAKRGRNCGNYVMGRIHGQGAYEPGNVQCVTRQQHADDRPETDRKAAVQRIRATREAHGQPLGYNLKGARGDAHPRSKAVVTPAGRFGSMALAADHHGITRQAVHDMVKRGTPGWRLE